MLSEDSVQEALGSKNGADSLASHSEGRNHTDSNVGTDSGTVPSLAKDSCSLAAHAVSQAACDPAQQSRHCCCNHPVQDPAVGMEAAFRHLSRRDCGGGYGVHRYCLASASIVWKQPWRGGYSAETLWNPTYCQRERTDLDGLGTRHHLYSSRHHCRWARNLEKVHSSMGANIHLMRLSAQQIRAVGFPAPH